MDDTKGGVDVALGFVLQVDAGTMSWSSVPPSSSSRPLSHLSAFAQTLPLLQSSIFTILAF